MAHFEFDAAIILSNLMDSQGNLNHESEARLQTGVELFKSGKVPLLVTCGWNYRPDSSLFIADAMRWRAIQHFGVPEEFVITETASRDTVGDAVFTKIKLAIPRRWKNLSVVTSAYHADRSRKIFEFIYGDDFNIAVVPAPSELSAELARSEQRSWSAFQETFAGVLPGDDVAILKSLEGKHPFYNGTIYPRI